MYSQPYLNTTNNLNANPQMMQMQLQMGMPLGMNMGGLGNFANMFMYSGNAVGLQCKLEGLSYQEAQVYREATINCMGNQIKEVNTCCIVCTGIWGGILIFPICFMCCNWWKKIAMPAFEIPISTYQALQNLICNTNLQTITLSVCDNKFDAQKAQLLFSMLSSAPNLKGFTFMNNTGEYDY